MSAVTRSRGSSEGSEPHTPPEVPQETRQQAVARFREMRFSFANRSDEEHATEVAREFHGLFTSDDVIAWNSEPVEEPQEAAPQVVSPETMQQAVDRFIELRLSHARSSDEEHAATVVEEFDNRFEVENVIAWTSEYEQAPRLPAGMRPGDVAPAGAALASSLASTGDEKKDDMTTSE